MFGGLVSGNDLAIYVLSPVGYRSGGPEALHQLVDAIRQQGVSSFILSAYPDVEVAPVDDFSRYDYEIVKELPKSGRQVLVVPEWCLTRDLDALKTALANPDVVVWVWWLSVDNSLHPEALRFSRQSRPSLPLGEGLRREVLRRTARDVKYIFASRAVSLRLRHLMSRTEGFLAQSDYARDFCKRSLNRDAMMLTDYLTPLPAFEAQDRQVDTVLYNGIKGNELIEPIRSRLPDVRFSPIRGMTYAQVCSALAAATVYLELGRLPGRDRLPREAARVGTPVVLLRQGAGRYVADFPLPSQDTFDVGRGWHTDAVALLTTVLADPESAQRRQAEFRSWVLADQSRFGIEVAQWLRELGLA